MEIEKKSMRTDFVNLVDKYKNIIFILLFIIFGIISLNILSSISDNLKNLEYIPNSLEQIRSGVSDVASAVKYH